jgi:catechol 2,3-dioxygenase-like lactoylglutathione lyase family enzyme
MKLDHIVLLVSEVASCITFYDVLLPLIGFEKKSDHIFGNSDGVYLDIRQAGEPAHGYHRHGPGLNHIGFTAENRAKIQIVGRAMAEAGFEVPKIQEFEDGSALFLRDLDGMRVEISSYV